ncbi:GNAT family N-acetyltransferase [Brevibacillus migulae]|uniref:GNAT family N-acetyltransferase n=1 Tax=Brevibacillus migulae TaxID=1644114 RepID=UPI00196B5B7D|nr:GNAT family protein [Brevibacillus migulae]
MLQGKKVDVRFLEPTDAEALLELHRKNRDFFRQFITTREDSFYTIEQQVNLIATSKEKREQDQQYVFGIFAKGTNRLIGQAALTEVLRGPLQSCYIGYFLDQEWNGKGCMTEAVQLVVEYAFRELKLHRIEAGVMPHNIASIRVLEKAGFQKEGIARKNVHINGRWEDHQVLAIINEDD